MSSVSAAGMARCRQRKVVRACHAAETSPQISARRLGQHMVAEAPRTFAPPPQLLTQLSRQLVGELRTYLARHRAELELGPDRGGLERARQQARMYDGLLMALFDGCRAATVRLGTWPALSLAAVGSYGRSTLAPCSDLD